MPKSSILPAMPMNSVMTLPKFVIRIPSIMRKVMRRPYSSRIRVAQALARNRSHASAHLLHHDQRDGDRDHGPQKRVAELRPGLRIGKDSTGIVVDICGDEARPYDGEEQQQPELPSSQKSHAPRSQERSELAKQNEQNKRRSVPWIGESAKSGGFFAAARLEASAERNFLTVSRAASRSRRRA
jgi:hypothetical protein